MNDFNDMGFFDFEDMVEELSEEQLVAVNGGWCGGGGCNGGSSGWQITYVNGGVCVNNTDSLTNANAVNNSYAMAEYIKAQYRQQYGRELDISTGSLAAEIKGHADLYNAGISQSHTDISNCGENDKERAVWSILSWCGYGQCGH